MSQISISYCFLVFGFLTNLYVIDNFFSDSEQDNPGPMHNRPANPTCCVCMMRPPNTVFIPCGHLNVCDTCAGILEAAGVENQPDGYFLCPICRTGVTHRQLVFGY